MVTPSSYNDFKKEFRGKIIEDEILAPYTTFKIGGPADLFYEARELGKLLEVTKLAKKYQIPYVILGNGSNVLVADDGFRGLVIKNSCRNFKIEGNLIVAESGAFLSQVLIEAANYGLGSNIWVLANIPGTVGGAVYGNAGSLLDAKMVSIGNFLVKAQISDGEGNIREVQRDYFQFGYRKSILKQTREIVLQIVLKDDKGNPEEILKLIEHDQRKRIARYPSYPFAGSYFKNPAHLQAGKLIEDCGLKGYRVGDAQVSLKHGNFIVNLAQAKASDVLKLAEFVKEKVKEKFGVELKEEIQLIGDFSNVPSQ